MTGIRFLPLALLFLAPLASAGSAPAIHFLQDGEAGPVGEGVLGLEWPSKNESSMRLVLPASVPAAGFAANQSLGTHIRGPLFFGVWPEAALVQDGRIHVQLIVDGEAVAEGFAPVSIDPSNAPDPTALVPPDPTDPEGAVMHVVAQAAPLILQPPTLVNMGMVDIEVPPDAKVEVLFTLVGVNGGMPQGLSVGLKYDGLLSPSYAYIPWWSADPEHQSPQLPKAPTGNAPPPSTGNPDDDAPAKAPNEDSPGAGLVLLLVAFAVAWVARRR